MEAHYRYTDEELATQSTFFRAVKLPDSTGEIEDMFCWAKQSGAVAAPPRRQSILPTVADPSKGTQIPFLILAERLWRRTAAHVEYVDAACKAAPCHVECVVIGATGCDSTPPAKPDHAVHFGCDGIPCVSTFPVIAGYDSDNLVGRSTAIFDELSEGPLIKLNPQREFNSNLGYVEVRTADDAEVAVALIRRAARRRTVIAFDVEYSALHGSASLLQILAGDLTFLFRLQLMQELGPSLKDLLSDQRTLKVGYGCRGDVAALKRDWGLDVMPTMDVADLALALGHPASGLKPLVRALMLKKLTKQAGKHDWDDVHYSERMIKYATEDVVATLACYQKLLAVHGDGNPCYLSAWWPKHLDTLVRCSHTMSLTVTPGCLLTSLPPSFYSGLSDALFNSVPVLSGVNLGYYGRTVRKEAARMCGYDIGYYTVLFGISYDHFLRALVVKFDPQWAVKRYPLRSVDAGTITFVDLPVLGACGPHCYRCYCTAIGYLVGRFDLTPTGDGDIKVQERDCYDHHTLLKGCVGCGPQHGSGTPLGDGICFTRFEDSLRAALYDLTDVLYGDDLVGRDSDGAAGSGGSDGDIPELVDANGGRE